MLQYASKVWDLLEGLWRPPDPVQQESGLCQLCGILWIPLLAVKQIGNDASNYRLSCCKPVAAPSVRAREELGPCQDVMHAVHPPAGAWIPQGALPRLPASKNAQLARSPGLPSVNVWAGVL